MPSITEFSDVQFVDVLEMKLEQPSVIVAGQYANPGGDNVQFEPFKFFIDEETDIDDVLFVLSERLGCSRESVGFVTAGCSSVRREGDEKLCEIFGSSETAVENDAYRFERREMMQCSIWPANYDEKQANRFAKMFDAPKIATAATN